MQCSLRWLRSTDRLPRIFFALSFSLFALTISFNSPALAFAEDADQETESDLSEPTADAAATPTPTETKPPYNTTKKPYVFGFSGSSPAPSTRSIFVRDTEAGATFDQRQFPVTPNQVFQQEPRSCTQFGCPHCRNVGRPGPGTAFAADTPPTIKLRPGEAAQVILELIDRVGPSVLDGTLYAQTAGDGDQPSADRSKEVLQGSPLEALVQWIRRAETERELRRTEYTNEVETPAPVQEMPVDVRQVTLVETLRTVAEQLDESANLLERQNLFYRADQLRDQAMQLRQESRSAQGGWSLRPLRSPSMERPPHPERDLKLEIEMLQDEVSRLSRALERKGEESRRDATKPF